MKILFSIIIPVYNAELFLRESINSVLNQTYHNFEIIIINDGSTDSSHDICVYFSHNYDNIKYISTDNLGVSHARNVGIDNSRGDYLLFLDADDILPNNVLELYNKYIISYKWNVIFGNHFHLVNDKIVSRPNRLLEGVYRYEDIKNKLLDDGTLTGILFGSVCGVCYKKSIINKYNLKFDSNVLVNEDGLFNIKLLFHLSDFFVLDECVYYYRQWKNKKSNKLTIDIRFHEFDKELNTFLKDNNILCDYINQLECRKVSVVFWNAIRIATARDGFFACKKFVKTLFSDPCLKISLKKMNYSEMNIYKKIICYLIYHNLNLLFVLIIRYLYPFIIKFKS